MRMLKRGEKGFTLIELLIVVAILGVLAAVIIPNVGQFIGAGESEARQTEFQTIQTAVHQMMIDNEIESIPTPSNPKSGDTATNVMGSFPDTATAVATANKLADPDGNAYTDGVDPLGDKDGYLLQDHDKSGNDSQAALVDYVAMGTSSLYYTCESDGTVRQWASTDASDATGTEYTY